MRRLALIVSIAVASLFLGPSPSPPAAAGPADRGTVRVAIVDSGADLADADLARRVRSAVDCHGAAGDPSGCRPGVRDDSGHGTHVADIVASVAPTAELLVVRALHEECDAAACTTVGDVTDVVAGLRWAVDAGADVVNLSIDLGAELDWRNGALARAIAAAWGRGVVVVASTGNGSAPLDDDLADVPVLLVGALDDSGRAAAYSNAPGNARWALLAPGGGTCVAGHGCLSGTSMAAAYVSGAAAVLLAGGLDAGRVVAALLGTADDLGAPGRDAVHGAGAVDLAAALATAPAAAGRARPTRAR